MLHFIMTKISDRELRDIRQRRKEARANMAIEGIHLTPEEEALFDYMDRQRMPPEERRQLIDAYIEGKFDVASLRSPE